MDSSEQYAQNLIFGELPPDSVREQLDRVLVAPEFSASQRMAAFLRFVVNEKLEGRANQIKQFTGK